MDKNYTIDDTFNALRRCPVQDLDRTLSELYCYGYSNYEDMEVSIADDQLVEFDKIIQDAGWNRNDYISKSRITWFMNI